MPSGGSRSPSIASSPSSGRRLFSALASPFKSKSRTVTLSVELDNPHKRYLPGEVVTGSVHLRVIKPIRVQHITICLRGFVQVYRNPNSPGDSHKGSGAYFANGRAKRSGSEYFGNGYASLFEDEEVLCGDGRLAEGAYQFNFEMEFPDRDLPSSITFERGTISYLVTATLTRPTTMSPTMTTDHEVFFVERIDISSLQPPKPRTITLEPVSRRSRARSQARKLVDQSERRSKKGDSNKTSSEPTRPSDGSSEPISSATGQSGQSGQSSQGEQSNSIREAPVSPTRSQISLQTATDDFTSQSGSQGPTSSGYSDGTTTNGSRSSSGSRVITAKIESLTGGCLRGDNIPIKVHVTHTKHVRSLYGVILTLYRQARVDMHPAIPLGPTEKGKGSKYEDYYPRSMTGLGGLSLSGGGSSHVFRKDLTQTMVPLMIDPTTLTAEVNAKVRVPEGAFPSISTVPGQMISFKYYVEVVLDIQGKLTGQDRTLGNLSAGVMPGHVLQSDSSDMERSAFTPFGSTIIDTASVRREKSVVSCSFEITVGTSDSGRKKGKQKAQAEAVKEAVPVQPAPQEVQQQAGAPQDQRDWYHDQYWYQDGQYYDGQHHDGYYQDGGYHYADYSNGYDYHDYGPPQPYDPPPPPVPIPTLPDESQMSEKERVRQAETRLLPSQPPGEDGQGSEDAAAGATAPFLPEETNGIHAAHEWPSVPAYEPEASGSGTRSAPSAAGPSSGGPTSGQQFPSVPAYEPPVAGSSSAAIAVHAGDDKQEMQRQRLQAEASAPPGQDDDEEEAGPSTAVQVPEHAPSAPALAHATNGDDAHADAEVQDLPQYER